MKYKNYYKILELNSNRATNEEIKNAYRKLAKKYHPDINPGDAIASEKFKDINEAYQVLSDENARKKFDRVYGVYKVRDTFQDTKEFFNADGISEMFQIVFGQENTERKKEGSKNRLAIKGEDVTIPITIRLQEAFEGANKVIAYPAANGAIKKLSFAIPRGIRNESKIRLEGQGKPGKNGGESGDLYIKVLYAEDKNFSIVGDDIYTTLKVTPWEAALGTRLKIAGMDSNVDVVLPQGTQAGDVLEIENEGFWKNANERGKLFITTCIVIPEKLSETEMLLFKKFSEISKYNPREK